jgi:hypothetical protein
MIGPKARPQQFGFKRGDHHLVVNGAVNTATAYDFTGRKLWTVPAIARGQIGNWRVRSGDTPPGLYRVGTIYRDWEKNPNPGLRITANEMSYGWYSLDLVELENQEAALGRAGIMIHGGGTALGKIGSWQPYQELVPTLGCVRMHNQDLRDKVMPLTKSGTLFVSVYQRI